MSKRKKTLQSSREPYLLRNKSKNQFLSSKPTTTAAVHSLHSLQATESGAISGSLAHDQRTEPATKENSHTAAATSQDVHCSPNTNMAPDNEATVSHSEFIKITEKIMDKLDALSVNVTAVRTEVSDMRNTLTELQTAVTDSSARLTDIENKALPQMKRANEKLETELNEKILLLELHDRKLNLLVYGVEKRQDEKVVEVVRDVIKQLGFSDPQVQGMLVVNAHRLPRRPVPGGDESIRRGPDPIIVRFGTMFDRDAVWNAYQRSQMRHPATRGQAPARLNFRLATDLPAKLKKKRFQLEQKAYQMRKNDNKSTRIKVIGVKVLLECREKGSLSAWKVVED